MSHNAIRMSRQETINALVERDGTRCQFPGCSADLDFSLGEGPFQVTIDHWVPREECTRRGWADDEAWDLSNLNLQERKCNAKKGNRVPNEDGTLPPKTFRKFRSRRDKRAQRPEICNACHAGRKLQANEFCNACGSGPMPERFPKWRQMKPKECDHDLFYCVACTIYDPEMRRSAINALIIGGEGYE